MDFSFSSEQTLLADSAQRFVQDRYGHEARRALLASGDGFGRDNWAQFAELGWLALPFAEELGGFGGSAVETMILMESFGRGLVLEPYVSSVVMAGGVLAAVPGAAQDSWLPQVMEGNAMLSLAFVEPAARFDLHHVETRAEATAQGFSLSGHKSVVLGGPSAQAFIVAARTAGDVTDREGISLFLVPADAAGLSRRDYPLVDGHRGSELYLEQVAVPQEALLGEAGQSLPLLEDVIDMATFAVAAEAVGAMEVAYKSTVEYCRTREQFGQPIGSFQVLQHRMVDMFIEHEQAKSLLVMAAIRLAEYQAAAGQADGGAARVEAQRAVAALKVGVGRGGRFVGQSAIQLHGGMGMTEEMAIGQYFKRLTAVDTLFGNVEHHLRRHVALAREAAA